MSLGAFANALREVLGLDPLYHDGRGRDHDRDEHERFYREPHDWGRAKVYDMHGMKRKGRP